MGSRASRWSRSGSCPLHCHCCSCHLVPVPRVGREVPEGSRWSVSDPLRYPRQGFVLGTWHFGRFWLNQCFC